MTILRSPIPDVPLPPPCSLFHYHFPPATLRADTQRNVFAGDVQTLGHGETAELDGQLPALADGLTGKGYTRQEVKLLSLRLGLGLDRHFRSLPSASSASPAPRVILVFSPNTLHYPILFLACQSVLLITSLANAGYTSSELAHQLRDSGAEGVFIHPDLVETYAGALEVLRMGEGAGRRQADGLRDSTWLAIPQAEIPDVQRRRLGRVDGSWRGYDTLMGEQTGVGDFEGKTIKPGGEHEVALLCYSSGTTGLAKGVMTTHHNLTSAHTTTRAIEFPLSPFTSDKTLCVLPMYHIYGLVVALLQPLSRGIPVYILPKFQPETFLRTIERYGITFGCIVPPIVVFLANDPAVEGFGLSSVKGTMSAAAPLGDGLVRKAVQRTKVRITQAYGLTETSPLTHLLDMNDALDHLGSIGKLLPNLTARIVDPGGNDVPDGAPGELLIKGPTVMKGYWRNESSTKGTFTDDGWFKTGDVAQRDREGYYYIVDRLKELIKYKGFQVPPADLEALLLTHPKVTDAAVIGIHMEEQATEVPRAYIVPRGGLEGLKTDEERRTLSREIADWVATKVANHKKLRGGVSLIDTIPKSAAGKILRRQLRVLAQNESAGVKQAKL